MERSSNIDSLSTRILTKRLTVTKKALPRLRSSFCPHSTTEPQIRGRENQWFRISKIAESNAFLEAYIAVDPNLDKRLKQKNAIQIMKRCTKSYFSGHRVARTRHINTCFCRFGTTRIRSDPTPNKDKKEGRERKTIQPKSFSASRHKPRTNAFSFLYALRP